MSAKVYQQALEYYPRLWSKARINALYAAGKLTKEERDAILTPKKEG